MSQDRSPRRCPTCRGSGAAVGSREFPFCSSRCRDIDLGRWLDEEYRVPDRNAEGDIVTLGPSNE